ncbi:MAG: hypothetical protein JSV35_01760 [Candidatus Bathyarchaeota archaeon]|nr:MAG: hypothetical protein JSV35_01760 [Candidatus Bathyarchaeota archaeon]
MPRLEIQHRGIFIFTVFYLIVGILNFGILATQGLGLFHVALVAVLSIITAFGLYRLQRWSLWLVVGLFFIGTSYAAFTLHAFLQSANLPLVVGLVIYIVLTWLASFYLVARREKLS